MDQGLLVCVLFIFVFMHVGPCHGTVRLVNGSRSSEGRLEVYYNGTWGTVCDDDFDVDDAMTVCKSLGYTDVPLVRPSSYYGEGSGPIWLDDVSCRSSHTDIIQCPHQGMGNHNCEHYEDVGIDCKPTTAIRLVGGGRHSAGRVEIKIGGRWGTVCDHSFDTDDARVVCRMLGHMGYMHRVHSNAYFGQGSGPVWLGGLRCFGNETDLLNCSSFGVGKARYCSHSDDAGVDCALSYLQYRSDLGIRLVSSSGSRKTRGRVEVNNGDKWGTVCDNSFDVSDAKVVCRMLGFTWNLTSAVKRSAFYGEGLDPIHLDKVACTGSESNIFSCNHSGPGLNVCKHNQDVGVDCWPPSGPSTVTISGPLYHITDGTKPLLLNCTANNFEGSVSFTWPGMNISPTITSAEYEIITFTPSIANDGNIVKCISTNKEDAGSVASASYTLRLKYPPSGAPVIIASFVGDDVVEGSDVTLTCIITGGNPQITNGTIACRGEGRTLTSADYKVNGNAVYYRLTIHKLRLEDNGTVCQCTGTWTTQPNLYTKQASMTLHVFVADAEEGFGQNLAIHIGAVLGGLVLVIIIVVVLVVVIRRHAAGKQIYERPGPKMTENLDYSDLAMHTVSPKDQSQDEAHDNAELKTEDPKENTYGNVEAVTTTMGSGQEINTRNMNIAAGEIYENTMFP